MRRAVCGGLRRINATRATGTVRAGGAIHASSALDATRASGANGFGDGESIRFDPIDDLFKKNEKQLKNVQTR